MTGYLYFVTFGFDVTLKCKQGPLNLIELDKLTYVNMV